MRSPSPIELLTAWEQGLGQSSAERGLALLRVALPEISPEILERLSVGERDACLLKLREETFGRQLQSLTVCPRCGERLEFSLDAEDLRVGTAPAPFDLSGSVGAELSVRVEDYVVRCRLPGTSDLLAAEKFRDPDAARAALIDRCFLAVEKNGETLSPLRVPDEIVEEVASRMAEADPQADVQLAVVCPLCTHQWQVTFDILSFLWREVAAWGARILHEIHALASAYGWSERQILEIPPARRRAYLELAAE
jgi:hypothetical protein